MPVPFIIYADVEAITKKVQGCRPNNDNSYTKAYQTHDDCGYGCKVVCCYDDKYSKPFRIYQGENAVYKFMNKMLHEVQYCKNIVRNKFNRPLKMIDDDELHFKQTKNVIFAIKSILPKMGSLETIVTLLESSRAELIKNAI